MVVPTIMPANSVSGYEVENSLRFNDADSAELTRTPGSEGDKQKHTISMWVKRCTIASNQALFSAGPNDSNVYSIRFISDSLYISQSSGFVKDTNRLFRDPSAWYHIVVAIDSTQSTLNDRIKVYINGVLETSFSENTFDGNQNLNTQVNDDVLHAVGYDSMNNAVPFDGYIAEFNLIDGAQKAASDFGKFDNNNEWIPIKYSGSYGTNGVFLEFKQTGTGTNASGMGADTSGNDLHYAPVNLVALDVTTDTCTNNFCTFSPLQLTTGAVVLSEGNTLITMDGDANYSGQHGTIGVSKGKWYWEMKALDSSVVMIGALTMNTSPRGDNTSDSSGNGMYYNYANTHYQSNETTIRRSNAGNGSLGNSAVSGGNNAVDNLADDDIVQIALDMDNNKIYFGLNGTFVNSSNPANGTNSFTLHTDVSNPVSPYAGADGGQVSANFGQPSFAISSSNADANGHGNFEYAVPSGYFALCTKNLAEFG